MKIIAINGSPNKEGNTKALLNRVLDSSKEAGAEEIEIYEASELIKSAKHSFCTVCTYPCTQVCYKGTELEIFFDKLAQADAIILGSPVYFGTMAAQLKALFDKTMVLRAKKKLYNKVAAGVTVGGSKYGGQETTMKALHDLMLIHGMIVVGDGYIEYDCGHHGVSAQKPAATDENALKRADILGKRIVEVARATIEIR